ncbi:hypothetical protein B9G69_015715 [Bdellovibrio sp. SKB1291214]|uniref:hypothetical protein n=1 Tax=Bdellovibrio sp. SKB1291214 TaxID=1732569 RepID=UPI000B51B210|nr:hypothetical protein [Bdellovibrio sp. SKB1291214]UYL08490.1 hypothetical protein B9G69_015715 [Bdellovibrio sp. SKB1291214]
MKQLFIISSIVLLSLSGFAQKKANTTAASKPSRTAPLERWLLTGEANTWVEKLAVNNTSGGSQESKASYWGFGVGLEKNFYYPKWGWGVGGGLASGTAVGGDANTGLKYFQARVPWMALRVTPRVFWRLGAKVDFGFDLSTYYKNSEWPTDANGQTATSGSKLITGGFADLRARIGNSFEYIQSFGMVYKDETMYWRIGLAYRM